jgi:hypothetical protein
MSDNNDALRDDVLKGTGFSPSVKPEQSQGAGSLGLQPEVSPEGKQSSDLEDFYMEGPYMVFTAAYHLRRGYCCNSDCRHCPYK